MIVTLYEANSTQFSTNGIGRLADAISVTVDEELNGRYEIVMQYPKNGVFASELSERRILLAKPNDVSDPQPFRIYKVVKNAVGKRITVYGQHLSYDLSGYPVSPFQATGVVPALTGLVSNSMLTNPFSTWTDISNDYSLYNQTTPASFRERLGGVRGSILDTFGGEFEWDGYTVKLHAHRGSDNGVSIRYGKNLTELENERSNESFYTGCVAYWEEDDVVVSGTVQYIADHALFPFEKIYTLDASQDFDDQPTAEQLNARAVSYINDNNLGTPFKDNLKIEFVPLWQTEEYKDIAPLERVSLGDTVHVVYEDLTVDMKVISYSYDVLAERYAQLELGTKKATLADSITSPIAQMIDASVTNIVSTLEQAIVQATDLIRGGLGGYVVINTNADGTPNEILIMDSPSTAEAINVIRMNQNGIGFSTTGYSGSYTTAWTIDGAFNADFITAGSIDGNLIRAASILTSALQVDAQEAVTGTIENVTFDGDGMHIARKDATTGDIASEYQSLFTELGMRVMDSNGNVTLSAEQDTVDAINLSAHTYLRVIDDTQSTTSRFQGFYNNIHNKAQQGIFWEED